LARRIEEEENARMRVCSCIGLSHCFSQLYHSWGQPC
jgi:hypothetical protein